MKKIFLTGSSGLLGSSIYKIFKKKFKIVRISNNQEQKKKNQIKYLNFSLKNKIKKFIQKHGVPDFFIHCGWGRMDEPMSDYHIRENFNFSKNLIDTFFEAGLKNFVFIGTINEYGENNGIVKESKAPLGELRQYEKGKIKVGKYGKKASKKFKKNFIHIRMANLFGPIKKKNSLIYSLHQSNKKNKNVKVSSLKFYRDYMHVDIASVSILKLLINVKHTCVVNIGSGTKIMMRKFVKEYWKRLNKNKNKIEFAVDEKSKTKNLGFYMSINKLQKITGENNKSTIIDQINSNIKKFKL